MPRGDGTGPLGQGPMTGRAAGYCAGYDRPGYANPNIRGYGLGMAYRRGFGWGGRGRGLVYYMQLPWQSHTLLPSWGW